MDGWLTTIFILKKDVTIFSLTNEDMAAGIATYGLAGMSGPELQKYMGKGTLATPFGG